MVEVGFNILMSKPPARRKNCIVVNSLELTLYLLRPEVKGRSERSLADILNIYEALGTFGICAVVQSSAAG